MLIFESAAAGPAGGGSAPAPPGAVRSAPGDAHLRVRGSGAGGGEQRTGHAGSDQKRPGHTATNAVVSANFRPMRVCEAGAMSSRAWVAFAAMSLIWGVPYLFIRVAVDD